MEHKGVCGWCVLGDMLTVALDDGTGQIRRELHPFHDRILAMPRPRTGILWLKKPHVQPLLHQIATGQVPPPAVIAPLLGYNATSAERIAAEAGNTWQHYAAGSHTPITGNNR